MKTYKICLKQDNAHIATVDAADDTKALYAVYHKISANDAHYGFVTDFNQDNLDRYAALVREDQHEIFRHLNIREVKMNAERRRGPTSYFYTAGQNFVIPFAVYVPEETGPDFGSLISTPSIDGYRHRITNINLSVSPPTETEIKLMVELSASGNHPFIAHYTTPELTIPAGNEGLFYVPDQEVMVEARDLLRYNFTQVGQGVGEDYSLNGHSLNGYLYLSPVPI